jgi:predicted NUDIX family NTP pyrophosphohydrolase
MTEFPEVDRGGWFNIPEARKRINAGQMALLDQLVSTVASLDRIES